MQQVDRLNTLLDRKRQQEKLSYRGLARKIGVNHSQISRLLNGMTSPTKEMLTKVCQGLQCSKEERIAIFHAAGFLAPDELEEEIHAA